MSPVGKLGKIGVCRELGFVRMNADTGVDAGAALGLGRPTSAKDGQIWGTVASLDFLLPTSAKGRQIWGTVASLDFLLPTSAKGGQIWGTVRIEMWGTVGIEFFGEADATIGFFRTVPVADGEHVADAAVVSTLDNVGAVGRVFGSFEVAVRVCKHSGEW
jgi:hypothetical protein